MTMARFIKDSKQLTKIIARNEPVYGNCDQLCILLGSSLFLLSPLIYRFLVPGVQMWSDHHEVSDPLLALGLSILFCLVYYTPPDFADLLDVLVALWCMLV